MAFWSSGESEPKRNYRFKIIMNALAADAGNVVWWAKTVSLPSYDVSEVEHNHLDNKYYFPGRVSWSEVSMTLVDPVTPDATDSLNNILVNSGYEVPGSAQKAHNDKGTISKKKSSALGDIEIVIVDADGDALETWKLNNAFLKSAKFGELDYSSDDLKQIELTVRYDWATCTTKGKPERFKKT